MIYQLIYYSQSKTASDSPQLVKNWGDILGAAHRHNARNDITGFLIFDSRFFVQILEGDRDKVSETYNRIKMDNRHASPMIINVRDVKARSFDGWDMGSAIRTPAMQEIFRAQGLEGPLNPATLKGSQVIQLARYLAAYQLACQDKSA